MNYLINYSKFDKEEDALKKLQEDVNLFNKLTGTVYKSAVYDDLIENQNILLKKGFDGKKIYSILSRTIMR